MSSRQAMDSASRLVEEAFFKVGQIEPPNPQASPGTKSAFNRMLTTVAQAAGQTLDLAVGLSAMSDGEDGSPLNLGLKVQEWRNFVNPQDLDAQDGMDIEHPDEEDPIPSQQPAVRDGDDDGIVDPPGETDGMHDEEEEEEEDKEEGEEEEEEEEEDEDPNEGVGGSTKKNEEQEGPDNLSPKVQKLVDLIFAGTEDDGEGLFLYDLNDLRDMILDGGYQGKVEAEEREAFRRMIIGYEPAEFDDIKEVFDRASLAVCSLDLTTERALKIGEIKAPQDRILQREKWAFLDPQHDRVTSYMLNVIRNIEGMRAFEEWEKQKGPFKKTFIRSLARTLYPGKYHNIETKESSPKEKKKEFTVLTTPIRKKHAKLMDRRKQISYLFQTFGPIVLLEPTFFKTAGTKGWPRASTHYIKVWHTVLRRKQDYELPAERYYNDRALVLGTMKALGGEAVEKVGLTLYGLYPLLCC
ncbi:hypothetical protein GYMLUDRAFT_494852 [Collybiopsis luxurians FD-317 M1]|uniref:Uncharacterized protein n=1 Tax=Collybiopsis luxurians FD-317 M1 TaxID=944289 RepID=A0A0D0AIX0_9AGAR|nr:hypothetical protein GYMLUDRAFT_494852 [Collybiopsis luxurians FD-317 M1]